MAGSKQSESTCGSGRAGTQVVVESEEVMETEEHLSLRSIWGRENNKYSFLEGSI